VTVRAQSDAATEDFLTLASGITLGAGWSAAASLTALSGSLQSAKVSAPLRIAAIRSKMTATR
jgi:hypothetical protein